MSNQSQNTSSKRRNQLPHSSYSKHQTRYYGGGIEVQCQYCPCQQFRRSSLRAKDLQSLLLMRYPVRCLRCGQRQAVSFAIASVSVPSHVKRGRHRRSIEKFPLHGFTAPPERAQPIPEAGEHNAT